MSVPKPCTPRGLDTRSRIGCLRKSDWSLSAFSNDYADAVWLKRCARKQVMPSWPTHPALALRKSTRRLLRNNKSRLATIPQMKLRPYRIKLLKNPELSRTLITVLLPETKFIRTFQGCPRTSIPDWRYHITSVEVPPTTPTHTHPKLELALSKNPYNLVFPPCVIRVRQTPTQKVRIRHRYYPTSSSSMRSFVNRLLRAPSRNDPSPFASHLVGFAGTLTFSSSQVRHFSTLGSPSIPRRADFVAS